MKKDKTAILRLITELENEAKTLRELSDKNRLMTKKLTTIEPDEFDWAALGYTIHNIYTLVEGYLLRIAKFFENDLDPSSWHKDLIRRMVLDIPETRPSFMDRNAAERLDELHTFRHAFRNIYQTALNVSKLKYVNDLVPEAVTQFLRDHDTFIGKLNAIAGLL
jgi:hypothetical protein